MNLLIYGILILMILFIIYSLWINKQNLYGVTEGFSGNLTGQDLGKSGRCANYKVNGRWVRDGV